MLSYSRATRMPSHAMWRMGANRAPTPRSILPTSVVRSYTLSRTMGPVEVDGNVPGRSDDQGQERWR